MNDNIHRDRAEQIMLTAESLERQMEHQGASDEAISLVADLVTAARDLHDRLAAAVVARGGELG